MSAVERLVIIGGGGFARELIGFAEDSHEAGRTPPVAGYIEDGKGETLAKLGYSCPWLGTITDCVPSTGDVFVLGIGDPVGKRRIVEMLKARGARFSQIIHPTALITRRTSLGEGVVFGPFSGSGTDTRIGAFVLVNSYSGFGHDSCAGDFTTLSAHVDVMGSAVLGEGVLVGSRASILPKVRIGNNAKVGAGAVVYRSVPPGATVFAPAAKLLKKG